MGFLIQDFLKSGKNETFKKNEHLLLQGEISRRVYFLVEGVVRHYVIDNQGNEKTIRLSKENDFFYSSNISFFNGEASYINCQALTPTKLLFWTSEEINELSFNPDFIVFENKKLKEFIIEKHKKEIFSLIKSADERLLEFYESDKSLFNRIPHKIIASYLDMAPETLSRLRAKLKRRKS